MPNRDGIVSIGFDYKKELDKMIREIETEMNTASNNGQMTKGMKRQFDDIISEIRKMKSDIDKELSSLGSDKVNKSSFKSFKQTVENRFKSIGEMINALNTNVSTLSDNINTISNGINLNKIINDFKSVEEYVIRTNNAIEELIHTLGQQGISLFSFDTKNISDVHEIIKGIDKVLKQLDKDTGAEFELFDEKQAQDELNKLSNELYSTLELMENAKKRMESMDASTEGFKKARGEFALLQLKAASLNETIETLYQITEDKGIYIEMDDKPFEVYERHTDELADNLKSIIDYAEIAKKELSSLLDTQKSPAIKVSSEMNPNSSELATVVTIETTSSELWEKLSPIMDDLQKTLKSNPVVAPVKLVVSPASVSSSETGNLNTSNAYSKKYTKILAQTGEDAVVDLEGVYKKTFTSVMDTATSYAKETIGKIQEIFDKNLIGVKFDISQEEIDKIQNFVLSNKDGKKVDISGQITKAKQEVEELNESIEKTAKLLDDTKSKGNVKFDGFDKFTQDVSKSIGKLEELQNILKALQNIEITLAKANGIASITELDNQWANVEKRILNATKLDGSFRKNASVSKIASEYQKYIDMGGTNSIADIDKIKDSKDTIDVIISKAKEFAKQDLSNDSLKELSIELDGIIGKFDELIATVKTATNALYKIIKQTGVSELDKQWSSITNKFKSFADESGKINLSKQRKDVEELLVMYQRYVNMGGSHTPFDLTDNLETVSKLDKAYKKLNETKPIDNSSTIKSETESFKQVEQSVYSLTKAIGDTKVQAINIEATAMEDAAEREILAINAIVNSLDAVVKRLKDIKGIKPKIEIKETTSPVETNISSGNLDTATTATSIDKVTNSLIEEQKAIGELDMAFRGVEGSLNGFMSTSGRLATFFTDSPYLARQYADSLGGVYQASLALGNSLEINGKGRDWNAIEYLGDGSDEASKKIIELRNQINALYDQLQSLNVDGTGLNGRVEVNREDYSYLIQCFGDMKQEYDSYIEAVEKGNVIENQSNESAKSLMIQLYELEKAYKAISDAKTNVYGTHTTDEFAELAKLNGYDSVMFRNIKDSFDKLSRLTSVGVIFDESQVANATIVNDKIDELVRKLDRISVSGLNLPLNIELPKEISKLQDGSFVNNLTGEIFDDLQEALKSLKELSSIADPIKDTIQGGHSDNSEASGVKQYKKKGYKAHDTGNHDNERKVANKKELSRVLKELQTEIIASIDESTQFVKEVTDFYDSQDNLVKTQMKIGDKNGSMSTYTTSYSTDKEGNSTAWTSHITTEKVAEKTKQASKKIQAEWDKNVKAIQEYMDANTKLNNLKAQDKGTGKKSSEIAYQTKEVERLEKVAIEARAALSSMINPHEAPIDDWNKWLEAMKQFDQATEGSARSVAQLEDALRNMAKSQLDSAQSKIDSYIKKLNPYTDTTKYTSEFISRVNSAQSEIKKKDVASPEALARLKEIESIVNEIIKDSNLLENKLVKQDSKIADIISKMKIFRDSNTNMSKSQRADLQALINSAEVMAKTGDVTAEAIEHIKIGFSGIKAEVTATGNTGLKMIDRIVQRAEDMNAKFIAQFFSWQDWLRYLREGFTIINEIDKSITELRKVSNGTASDLKHALNSATEDAKELGSSISNIVSMQSDWARLGFSIPESEELARVTQLYVNVGDNMSAETASENLISTLQGFQLEAEDSERIIDMFNEVANNFAIDTQGIGEALKRSAASFNSANTSLSESIALVTTANAVVQDPDSIGTTFKTMSARIRGAETELESLGEETDEYTKTTSKLRDLIEGLTGFDIMEDEDTFKSIYDIVLGIGKEWDKLSDIEQASLGEAIAGKRNANVFYSVMQNIDELEDAYKTAEESAGKQNYLNI